MMTKDAKLNNLGGQMYELIQNHYNQKSKPQLCQGVKTQIIPLLIQIFFQTNYDTNRSKSKIEAIKDENGRAIGPDGKLNITLYSKNERQKQTSSQNYQGQISRENLVSLANIEPDNKNHFLQYEKCFQKDQKSWNKVAGTCFIFLHLSEKMKKLQRIFLEKLNKGSISRRKGIISLQCFIDVNKKTNALMKFYLNFKEKNNQMLFCKALHKLYLRKMSQYWKKPFRQQEGIQMAQRFEKIHKRLKEFKIVYIKNIVQKRQREVFSKIKEYSLMNNPWMKTWVRTIVLKTNPNLQTSFWRLKTYVENSKQTKQDKFGQENSSQGNVQLDISEKAMLLFRKMEMFESLSKFKSIENSFEIIRKYNLAE